MSIIRVGLSETKNFAEGYEAIFGKKAKSPKAEAKQPAQEKAKTPTKKGKKK